MTKFERGQELFEVTVDVTRDTLVRYAGASGDFNPIHYNDSFATSVGLPGVIAHGMATMGLAAGQLVAWLGDPGAVVGYKTRFARPVEVPALEATQLTIRGRVGAPRDESGVMRVDIDVLHEGQKVLLRTQASVRVAK